MHVLSVNVSLPRDVLYQDRVVSTGIFKESREGRVAVRPGGLEGDGQADLQHHGGLNKAVYAYPHEHYAHWSSELGQPLQGFGALGENLTVRGLREESAGIGDVLRIGSALLQVAQPRKPCFKLGIRVGSATFPKSFLASGHIGFYLRVLQEGDIGAGDTITIERAGDTGLSVHDIWRIVFVDKDDHEGARRALTIPWLGPEFRIPLERRLGVILA